MFTRLACSLVGLDADVELVAGSLAHRVIGATRATVPYRCSFGLNPAYRRALEHAGVVFSGFDADGEIRVAELPTHPFWLALLFVPEELPRGAPAHGAIDAFVGASAVRARARAAGSVV